MSKKVLYMDIETEPFTDVSDGQNSGFESQYYLQNKKMMDYMHTRSEGPWTAWHELGARYERHELHHYGTNEVYKYVNQNIIIKQCCALMMDRWWRAVKEKHTHIGCTYAEMISESALGVNLPDIKTIKGWLENGCDKKIIGWNWSQTNKKQKKYYPAEKLLEYYMQSSRARFLFYQNNSIGKIAKRIDKRITENPLSGLYFNDGKKHWE